MSRVGSCGPSVPLDPKLVPEGQKSFSDLPRKLQRLDTTFLGGLLHFLPMLIDARQKERRSVKCPMISGNDVAQNFFVRVPDVWVTVRVINCGCEEIFHVFTLERFCRPRIRYEPLFQRLRLL